MEDEMLTLKRHKRGSAYCRYKGKCHWFGRYGTRSSQDRFESWLATIESDDQSGDRSVPRTTLLALASRFMTHAHVHYRKDGQPTGEAENVCAALRKVCAMYGNLPVDQFGPKLLKSVQQGMVDDGLARSTINSRINRIRRVFKWGVSEQIVPVSVFQSLQTVAGLQAGRSTARETAPVEPVPELQILAVEPHVSRPVWGLIQFMLLTGARPSEAVRLRWCDIDAESDVWIYRPGRHKTEHHGKSRVVMIGPRAQALIPHCGGRDTDYVFNPQQGLDDHARNHYRDTATTRSVNECYSTQSFRTAVLVACERAFECPAAIRSSALRKRRKHETDTDFNQRRERGKSWRAKHCWSPNQLRHNKATELRAADNIEAAQVILGHSSVKTTERYAEQDLSRAVEIARIHG